MPNGNGNSFRVKQKIEMSPERRTDFIAVRAVLESVMSGTPAEDLVSGVETLAIEDRRLLFAVLWAVREDVAQTCQGRVGEIDKLIRAYEFGGAIAGNREILQTPVASDPKPAASEGCVPGAFRRASSG